MKKFKSILLSLIMVFTAVFGFFPQALNYVTSADALSYPVQAVNFSAFTTDRNLNLSGTALDAKKASGSVTENWSINYISEGVYNICSMSDGQYLTAGQNGLTVSPEDSVSARWNITGTDKDFEGYYLYYKITNISTGKAITYYQNSNAVSLADYTGDGAQKWKLNCYGLNGFAANCMVNEGEKACAIGGLLGKTVYVGNAEDLKNAMDSAEPLTIVVNGNIDCSSMGYLRVRDNKTVVGSYQANRIQDCMIRTNNEYGNEGDEPSDNIIFRNIDFEAWKNEDKILIQIWSSRNIWIDHCTFNSTLPKNRDEVGKFIWINTPYESYMDAKDRLRSPDYITLSYNTFTNRYWTVAYGTQNTETGRCRTSVMYNVWDSCIRRCPQVGNGSLHTYNNFHVRNTTSEENDGNCQIICGEGSTVYSESNRFEKMQKESSGYWDQEVSIDSNASFADSGSFTDKTENGGGTPYELTISGDYKKTAWRPSSNYGYTLLSAYNKSGENDVKDFCMNYAGTAASLTELKYISDEEFSSLIIKTIESPFLKESFDSEYATEEYTPAVLSEGAVYMIKNINSGLYMEVDGGKTENGANVQQWGADSAASHNTWRVLSAGEGYYYLYSQIGDKITYLLDVTNGSADNGTNIQIYSDTKADAQQFKFIRNNDGSYCILTKASNDKSCIAVSSASESSGASIVQWSVKNSDASQKWELIQVEDTGCKMDTSKLYMFKNSNSGLYMEVQNGAAEDGANVQQWGADSPLSHNSWTLKEFGGGYYYIISQLADGRTYYLNIAGGSGENGTNAEILTNNKTSSHLFKFVKNPDGTYYILTRASKDAAAIETANADKSSGANISQWTVNGNSCQKWLAEEHVIATVTTTSVPVTTTSTVTTTTSVPATSGEESDGHIKGDINFDEKISVADLVLINNYLTGKEQFTYDQYSVSDLNNDGFINIFDVISLRRIILGTTD